MSWEFFKPIRMGDSFRVWQCPFTFEDKTRKDGKGLRMFLILDDLRFYNQNDELVCIRHNRRLLMILPPAKPGEERLVPTMNEMAEYKYTKQEMDFIDRVCSEEIRQGAEIRWWEDVSVGDDLQPIANGPITIWDTMLEIAGIGVLAFPVREVRKQTPQKAVMVPKPASGTRPLDAIYRTPSLKLWATRKPL